MYGQQFLQNHGVILLPPQTMDDAAVDSEWISLENYGHATVLIGVGDTVAATMAVTIRESTSITGGGEQVLTFTNEWSTAQKLIITTVSGAFTLGETLTQTSGNSNTAEIVEIGADYLIVRHLTNGTTWGDGNLITGGSSSVTAYMVGTGQNEDLMVPKYSGVSSSITTVNQAFKAYGIEIDADSLSTGYTHIQVACASASLIAGGFVILSNPRHRGIPMPSAISTQKYVDTSA